MLKKSFLLLMVICLVSSLFFVGCTGNVDPETNTDSETNTDPETSTDDETNNEDIPEQVNNPAKDRGNILTVGIEDFEGVFNPLFNTSKYDGYINDVIFDGLVSNDPSGSPVPCIAESWEISEDLITYTFHLVKGIKFHDGEELTTEDIKFTYETIASAEYTGPLWHVVQDIVGAQEFRDGKSETISGINIIDEYNVSFTLKDVNVAQITNFGLAILPEHIYKFDNYADIETLNQNPVGSGAFKFKRLITGQFIELETFDEYFEGRPKVDGIIARNIPSVSISSEAQIGSVDIAKIATDPAEVEMVTEKGIVEVKSLTSRSYSFAGFNLRLPKFQDKRVRQALVYGLNRKALIENYYKGYANVAHSPVPPSSWAYTEENLNPYDYDPQKAKELLEEAGWTDIDDDGWIENEDGEEFKITWLVQSDSEFSNMLVALAKENWKELGIQLELTLMERNSIIQKVYVDRDFEMYNLVLTPYADPDPRGIFDKASDQPGGINSVGFYNEEAEELFIEGIREPNIEKRKEIYQRWSEIANEELPYIFLVIKNDLWAVNQRVKNFNPTPYYSWTLQAKDIELEY